MRHADHDLLHARARRRAAIRWSSIGIMRVAAFAREALLPDVLRVQVALERLRRGQALEDVLLLRPARSSACARIGSRRSWMKRLVAVSEMYMYSAPSVRQYVSLSAAMMSRRRIRCGPGLERADVELGVQVGLGEAVGREVEVGDVRRLLPLQRIEVGVEHAERAELADEPQHEHLLVHRRRVDHRARDLAVACASSTNDCDDRRVRDVGRAAAQLVEVRAPLARSTLAGSAR